MWVFVSVDCRGLCVTQWISTRTCACVSYSWYGFQYACVFVRVRMLKDSKDSWLTGLSSSWIAAGLCVTPCIGAPKCDCETS